LRFIVFGLFGAVPVVEVFDPFCPFELDVELPSGLLEEVGFPEEFEDEFPVRVFFNN